MVCFPYTCPKTQEWSRPLDCRVDVYHTQVDQVDNTHIHRVTHIQKVCKCTHTDMRTQTHTQRQLQHIHRKKNAVTRVHGNGVEWGQNRELQLNVETFE